LSREFMLNSLSDEELVSLARGGDNRALSVLTARYFTKGAAFGDAGYLAKDDLRQEAMLGFLSAVAAYSPANGASFETFARVCMNNSMRTAAARSIRTSVGTEPVEELPDDAGSNPYDEYESFDAARVLMDTFASVLTQLEYKAFSLSLCGFSCRDSAQRLGVTEKSVENALHRARKKLRDSIPH